MPDDTPPVLPRELDRERQIAESIHSQTVFVIESFRGELRDVRNSFVQVQGEQRRCRNQNRALRKQVASVKRLLWILVCTLGGLALAVRPEVFWSAMKLFGGGAH